MFSIAAKTTDLGNSAPLDRGARHSNFTQDERERRGIVDAIPQPVVVLSPDGTDLYQNKAAVEYTGLSLLKLPTRNSSTVQGDVEELRDQVKSGLANGLPFQLEQRTYGRDGRRRWFLVHYRPLRNEDGEIVRWYATGTA